MTHYMNPGLNKHTHKPRTHTLTNSYRQSNAHTISNAHLLPAVHWVSVANRVFWSAFFVFMGTPVDNDKRLQDCDTHDWLGEQIPTQKKTATVKNDFTYWLLHVNQALLTAFVVLILWYVNVFKITALSYPQRGDTESDQNMLFRVKQQDFLWTYPVPIKGVIQTNFHLWITGNYRSYSSVI